MKSLPRLSPTCQASSAELLQTMSANPWFGALPLAERRAMLRSTRARVARRLLLLARGDATQAAEARPVVPVSQEQLAMMLGVTRQTWSKELKSLVAPKAIRLGYGHIAIASVPKLEELSLRA